MNSDLNEKDLEECWQMEQMVRRLTARIKVIKDMCRIKGSFCTESFVCAVTPQERRAMASIEAVAKIYGLADLESKGLIKTHEFTLVKISPKGWILKNQEYDTEILL